MKRAAENRLSAIIDPEEQMRRINGPNNALGTSSLPEDIAKEDTRESSSLPINRRGPARTSKTKLPNNFLPRRNRSRTNSSSSSVIDMSKVRLRNKKTTGLETDESEAESDNRIQDRTSRSQSVDCSQTSNPRRSQSVDAILKLPSRPSQSVDCSQTSNPRRSQSVDAILKLPSRPSQSVDCSQTSNPSRSQSVDPSQRNELAPGQAASSSGRNSSSKITIKRKTKKSLRKSSSLSSARKATKQLLTLHLSERTSKFVEEHEENLKQKANKRPTTVNKKPSKANKRRTKAKKVKDVVNQGADAFKQTQINKPDNREDEQKTGKYTVEEILRLSENEKSYPPKYVTFGDITKQYTPVLHFFTHPTRFAQRPDEKVEFICKYKDCPSKLTARFGELTNLYKHLYKHDESRKWFLQYKKDNGITKKIPEKLMSLVKWFVASYSSLTTVQDDNFYSFVDPTLKIPSYKILSTKVIPSILECLRFQIDQSIGTAYSVSLIPDGWTANHIKQEFLGLAGLTINENFEKSLVILGMDDLPNGHCAEFTKEAIENIVRIYDFDKAKIRCNLDDTFVCDQGSNYQRLVGQISNQPEPVYDTSTTNEPPKSNPPRPFIQEFLDVESEDESPTARISRKLYTIQEVDEEIDFEEFDVKTAPVRKPLRNLTYPVNIARGEEDLRRLDRLEQLSREVFEANEHQFDLKIGSSEIPRFNCSCHKLNLAIRLSIEQHAEVYNLLDRMNSVCARIRRSVELSAPFIRLKCRLRVENDTRWSSSFLMIEAILRAFDRGAFCDNVDNDSEQYFPFKRDLIEQYYQILREVHLVSLNFQRLDCSIAQVVPALLRLMFTLETLHIENNVEARIFCAYIVKNLKIRFEYELNSPIYLAAAALRIKNLSQWIGRNWSSGYFTKAIEALPVAAREYLFKRPQPVSLPSLTLPSETPATVNTDQFTPKITTPKDKENKSSNFNTEFFCEQDSGELDPIRVEREIFDKNIATEVNLFTNFVRADNGKKLEAVKNTADFWNSFKNELPNLRSLALILLGIPCSSAAIERYFSMCGFMSKKQGANINKELFTAKCILRGNFSLLDILEDVEY